MLENGYSDAAATEGGEPAADIKEAEPERGSDKEGVEMAGAKV